MLASSSVSFVLLKYLRKAFIFLWLPLACKDFKSWESPYLPEIKIKFEIKKDQSNQETAEDLQSFKLVDLPFIKQPIVTNHDANFLLKNDLSIPLDPNVNAVSFELSNNVYYSKVTIYYERICSLISPEAGGLQLQYTIKAIQFSPKNSTRPIFKDFKINYSVPLKEHQKDGTHHVTLYY